jgi:ADP-heptose:LPS heptosyltransferase
MCLVAERILIYRLGSLGDTVVALPALHWIAKMFPNAERWVLTNFSVNSRAAPMAQVLNGTGLVDGYIEYPIGLRDLHGLWRLRQRIRELRPNALVYLTAPRGSEKACRDAAFFRFCGVWHLIGVPYTQALQKPRMLDEGHYEYEGARLLRCLGAADEVDPSDPALVHLRLSDGERDAAQRALEPVAQSSLLLAASIGAKVDVNDWGDENWSVLLTRFGRAYPDAALVMLGAGMERKRSEALLRYWRGGKLNLCGKLSVRESAAMLESATLFIGHDSGPMHLAAAVGTPCVAVFSSRNLPGEWFPHGAPSRVLYRAIDCQGCKLNVCKERGAECIRSITVCDVLEAVREIL